MGRAREGAGDRGNGQGVIIQRDSGNGWRLSPGLSGELCLFMLHCQVDDDHMTEGREAGAPHAPREGKRGTDLEQRR